MDELKEQISELRQALKDGDFDDEQREAAEKALRTLEESFEKLVAAANEVKSEDEPKEEPASEERQTDSVDLSPVTEALGRVAEAMEAVAKGQESIVRAQQEVLSELKESKESVKPQEKQETESRKADTSEVEAKVDSLRKLIEDTVPKRRGAGPNPEEDKDEAQRLEEAVSKIEDPGVRLRALLEHCSGERSLI